jgi:hypothetical protein
VSALEACAAFLQLSYGFLLPQGSLTAASYLARVAAKPQMAAPQVLLKRFTS